MKEKLNSIIITSFLIIMFSLGIILKDDNISYTERRKLSTFPNINLAFFDNFEKYALDQFPFRDIFRSIKAFFNLNILKNNDNNKYVLKDNYIYKLEYPLNEKSVNNFINMINYIKNDFINNNIYISVIPDKSYFLSDSYLKINYNFIFNEIRNINNITYIPLNDLLKIDNYYKTDTHWIQSSLVNIVNRFGDYMNFKNSNNYIVNKYNNFKGVYYGQLGLNIPKENLEYLTNDIIDRAVIEDIENTNENKVYNLEKLNTIEPYDVYLNGSTPLLNIYNSNAKTNKELIIFRDSFGSSIAPLFIESYQKITLIDLRYLHYDLVKKYIDINNQDVLFLYSTLLINNSDTLKY